MARSWRGLSMEDTIIHNEHSFLCILDTSYARGKMTGFFEQKYL